MNKEKSSEKKRALFLGGGGARGAFQIGALKHLIGDLGRRYDIVSGFSVGALSGAMVAAGDFDELLDIWEGMNSFLDVFGGNPKFYKGLLSQKPLRRLIEERLDIEKLRASPTELFFTAVNVQTGRVRRCDKFSEPLVDWLLASAAIPGAFPPVEIDGEQFVDGGVLAHKSLAPAIHAGADEIDVILCIPVFDWSTTQRFESLVETAIRSIELAQSQMIGVDIAVCESINSEVSKWHDLKKDVNMVESFVLWNVERKKRFPLKEFRYIELNIIEPPPDVSGIFDFGKDKIHNAIEVGYKKAVDVFSKITDNTND